jgi:lipopolysaccharide transport system permease protein
MSTKFKLIPLFLERLWRYRDFMMAAVARDFQARYRHSLLGASWSIIQPICMVLIYTVIFSKVMQTRLPNVTSEFAFSIYLCAGLLPWGFFSESLTRLTSMYREYAHWLKKLHFPHATLWVITLINCSIHFLLIFFLFILFLLVTNQFPGLVICSVIPVFFLQVFFTLSLGSVLAIMNVFFRDVSQLLALGLQFWFWLTPIVYPIEALPKFAQTIIQYNPLTALMAAYQQILVYAQAPQWQTLLPLVFLSIFLGAIAFMLARQKTSDILDEL